MPIIQTTKNVSSSSNSVLSDTGLQFIAAADRMYYFAATLPYTAAATTTGLVVAIDTPASPTFFSFKASVVDTATVGTASEEVGATATDAAVLVFTDSGLGTSGNIAEIVGYIKPSVTGLVNLQFRSEVNASAITILGGARMVVEDKGVTTA